MKALKQFKNIFGVELSKRKHLEILALLLCVEVVLAFSYIGYISIPPISFTTLQILVIVAGMLFGPWDACAVAGVFALTSIWKASSTTTVTGDIAFSPFLSGNPLGSVMMAVVARLLFAIAVGYLFRWFFSKERKYRYLGIVLISIFGVALHSMLVYACMLIFFNSQVQSAQTTTQFVIDVVVNNLITAAVTVGITILDYKLIRWSRIKNFFEKTLVEEKESKETNKSKGVYIVLIAILLVTGALVALHLFDRLNVYINTASEPISDQYIRYLYSLFGQYVAGIVGLFGIVVIVVFWMQQFFASLALEANIRSRESAESLNKEKTMFLFNMSHDIRTPMNAILGYTDISLRHIDNTERVKENLQKIKLSGDHLLSLINDILEMSRIESGKLKMSYNPTDITKAIKSVCFMSQALAVPKSINFETNIGQLSNPYVFADELHMNEVLINLVSNAVKYTDEGGAVKFNVSQVGVVENDTVIYRFEVSDTGIGMSEEFQKHIFETFSREDRAKVARTEGAGIGLSIVKRIVDLAKGRIFVNSKPNEGSTFIVEVPFRIMSEAEIATFTKEVVPLPDITGDEILDGKMVLLVEDNPMNREIASDILHEAGLFVDCAEDGEVAVKIISEKGADFYDFILMDIQMPVMNGYEATKLIRKLPGGEKIPMIALSANAFKEDIDKAFASGLDAHIAKPIDVNKLIETLRALSHK